MWYIDLLNILLYLLVLVGIGYITYLVKAERGSHKAFRESAEATRRNLESLINALRSMLDETRTQSEERKKQVEEANAVIDDLKKVIEVTDQEKLEERTSLQGSLQEMQAEVARWVNAADEVRKSWSLMVEVALSITYSEALNAIGNADVKQKWKDAASALANGLKDQGKYKATLADLYSFAGNATGPLGRALIEIDKYQKLDDKP